MNNARPSRRDVVVGLGAGAVAAVAAKGAQAADVYQGKTLTMVVGFAPGGGVDSTARLLARHLVRFIPGQPGLIVQNMEGAGGVVSANYLVQRAAADGLTIAVPGRSWFVEGVAKGPGIAFDPARLSWIGSPGGSSSYVYVHARVGIKNFDDWKASPRPLTFGALASSTTTALIPTMLAATGLPIKVVTGYGATARIVLAIEQGEVDAIFTVEETFARRMDLLRGKVIVPIMRSLPGEPKLPLVRDALPASEGPVLKLVLALDSFGLPLVAPPAIPAERLDTLRRGFMAMSKDKDYQADAAKIELPVGEPIDGDALTAMINDLAAAATPDVVAAYRRLSGPR